MLERIQQLVAHMKWADERVMASLSGAGGTAREGREGRVRALEIYAHILGAEHVWLTRLKQEPAHVAVWPLLDANECADLARANAEGFERFVSGLAEADLDRTIPYTNSAGAQFESTIADMLLQALMHGCYHRGQVAMLVRDSGAEPSPTDYIAFVRGAPAATRV